MNHKKGG